MDKEIDGDRDQGMWAALKASDRSTISTKKIVEL